MAPERIGTRIAAIVASEHASQRRAAEAWGVNSALLSRWITNEDRPPGEETIQMIAEREGYNPWWIRYGIGRQKPGSMDDDRLRSILEVVSEHGDIQTMLTWLEPDEALRAAFKAAMSEGWGMEAIQGLTAIAGEFLSEAETLRLLTDS